MSVDRPPIRESDTGPSTVRRLALDLEDLRFENARLKASIAERQAEIERLSDRLGLLQAEMAGAPQVRIWRAMLRTFEAMRVMLRRR